MVGVGGFGLLDVHLCKNKSFFRYVQFKIVIFERNYVFKLSLLTLHILICMLLVETIWKTLCHKILTANTSKPIMWDIFLKNNKHNFVI